MGKKKRTSRAAIDAFLAQKRLALVGASRTGKGFGNAVLKELRTKGYDVTPVHPEASELQGLPCEKSLSELSGPVGGAVLVVPPAETEKLVREAKDAGIPRVWMQPGAESADAVRFCEADGPEAVHGECILMYIEPVRHVHRFHRFLRRLFGRMPK
jgi:predicted CoA-binding protein